MRDDDCWCDTIFYCRLQHFSHFYHIINFTCFHLPGRFFSQFFEFHDYLSLQCWSKVDLDPKVGIQDLHGDCRDTIAWQSHLWSARFHPGCAKLIPVL